MRKQVIIFLITLVIGLCFTGYAESDRAQVCLKNGLDCLKARQDQKALSEFAKTLRIDPENLPALCGKAEALRRSRKFKEAEEIIQLVLSKSDHPGCMNNLAYIRYYQGRTGEALKILKSVLKQPDLDKENKALAYLLIGTINAKLAKEGGLIKKLAYAMRIKKYFRKAKELAPDLPEVCLGLGTFYLMAPGIIGGDLEEARSELACAVEMTPEFATANARLAQVYRRQQDEKKFCYYFERTQELDPENEVLKEIEKELDE